MKTISPKSVIIIFVISLFSISVLASGLSFRVRILEEDKPQIEDELPAELKIIATASGLEVGDFRDYFQAMKHQYILEEKGISNTIIVSYFNYVEISLDDAFTLLDNRNEQDEQMIETLSEAEMELALKMVQNEDFYYAVQIGVYSEEGVNRFFDFPKKVDESITPKGYYRYTYGRFYTLQDAKDAMIMLQENYFENAFVVAFDKLERIPLTAAIEKEKRLLEESIAAVSP